MTTGPALPTRDVAPAGWLAALGAARDEGYVFFDWLSAVDELDEGFAVVAHLVDPRTAAQLLVRTLVARAAPVLASATGVFRGADWHERETAEMFGIAFTGHPDPRPLLLPPGAVPALRKDVPLAGRGERPWPGSVDPADHGPAAGRRRRVPLPPGVPEQP